METAEDPSPARIDPLDLSNLERVLGGPLLAADGKIDPAVLDRFQDHHVYAGLLARIAARLSKRKRMNDWLRLVTGSGRGASAPQVYSQIDRITAKLHRDAAIFIRTVELLNTGAGR